MNTAGAIHERREEILRVAARHGAGNIRLFGSAASLPSWKNSWASECRL
jgi:hypothetical protein